MKLRVTGYGLGESLGEWLTRWPLNKDLLPTGCGIGAASADPPAGGGGYSGQPGLKLNKGMMLKAHYLNRD